MLSIKLTLGPDESNSDDPYQQLKCRIPEFESRQTPIGHNIMMVTRSKHAATAAAAVAMSGGSCGQRQRH